MSGNERKYSVGNILWKALLWILLAAGLLFHFYYYFTTSRYLVTFGIFIYMAVSIIIYYLLLLLKKLFRFRYLMRNVRLTVTVVCICFVMAEMIFILTGYKSTSLEKRNKFYYVSQYLPERQNWLHVWRQDHYLQTDEYNFHRTINSLGLSDKEPVVAKKENEYRIVGLGDSFTEGDGASQDSTWLRFLERSLRNYNITKPLSFINAGVCGSDPYFEYMLLKEELLKYKPDLVILAINGSEIDDLSVRGGMERFLPGNNIKFNDPPVIEPVYASCRLSRLIFSALKYDELLIRRRFKSPIMKFVKDNIYQSLCMFKALADSNSFRLLVVFNPLKPEIENNSPALGDVMNSVRSDKTIDYLDLLDYYKTKERMDQTNVSSYYWKKDGHHNANGYAAFARGVIWKLNELGIIDSLKK